MLNVYHAQCAFFYPVCVMLALRARPTQSTEKSSSSAYIEVHHTFGDMVTFHGCIPRPSSAILPTCSLEVGCLCESMYLAYTRSAFASLSALL